MESYNDQAQEKVRHGEPESRDTKDTNGCMEPAAAADEGRQADVARVRRDLITQRVADLPPFDSPEFWLILEATTPLVLPEVLVWAARKFHLQGERRGVERVFHILYCRYDPVIRKWAGVSPYVRGSRNRAYVDDTSSHTWERLAKIFLAQGTTYLSHDRFTWAFEAALLDEVKTNARTVVRQAGGGVPIPSRPKGENGHLSGANGQGQEGEQQYPNIPEGEAKPKTTSKMSLRQRQQSLDAPLPGAESEERVSLHHVLPDSRGEEDYDLVQLLHTLLPELKDNEKEILLLLANGHDESVSNLARVLNIDHGTAKRRMKSIRSKAAKVLALVDTS